MTAKKLFPNTAGTSVFCTNYDADAALIRRATMWPERSMKRTAPKLRCFGDALRETMQIGATISTPNLKPRAPRDRRSIAAREHCKE